MGLFNRGTSHDDKADDALRDNVQEKSSSAIKTFYETLRFNRHKKLERRIVYTGAALFVLLLGMGVSWHHKSYVEYLESQRLTTYNTDVSFSKSSSVSMQLSDLKLSKDKKTVFIPFTFSNLDSISSDANNYYVIVLPTNGALQYYPSGQFILFGTSGRGVITLHNETGFPNQPLRILIRNDKNLGMSDDDANSDIDDSSNTLIAALESKYDMLDFTVNPGATHRKKNSSVDVDSSNTPTQLYDALFGTVDNKIIDGYDKDARKAISTDIKQAAEYRQRLETEGFKVPNDPAWMSDTWKPYDWVQDDGVPYNMRNKLTADAQKQKALDGTLNQASNSDLGPDAVTFPGSLKRADGSTTDDSAAGAGAEAGTGGDTTINGSSIAPSTTWSNLQNVWNDVLTQKRTIYVVDAMTRYRIKVFGDQQKQLASVGSKSHFNVKNVQA